MSKYDVKVHAAGVFGTAGIYRIFSGCDECLDFSDIKVVALNVTNDFFDVLWFGFG